MPNVAFWRGTTLQIADLPIKDGQLVYNTETGQIYQDFGIERIELGKTGGGGSAETPVVPMVDTTATLEPNTYYQWGEVASLTLSLGEAKPDVLNEYMFEFKSGEVATTVIGLESIEWPMGLTISPNKTYQVSIVNGIGVTIADVAVEKADVIRVIDMTETTATLLPNTFYKWGEVAELNISLGSNIPNMYSEFMFEFKSGEVATVISGLTAIKWLSGYKVEPNKTYQVSILNGIGVIGGV